MVTAMLISSGMSQDMWGEAILTATYLLNKIPRKEKEETPYELWMGRKPSYQYLRVWGCLAKVAVPPPKAQKIGPKSVDCIFIGYAKKSTAYRFIVHESKNPDIQKNAIMESRNAFKSERPRISKPRFASQVDVNNDLSKPVTTHHLPKRRESAPAKPHHMIAPSSSSVTFRI
ncbi:retrotransposon protein, putative, ty1-copia subclass [Tanacetum coccineum]